MVITSNIRAKVKIWIKRVLLKVPMSFLFLEEFVQKFWKELLGIPTKKELCIKFVGISI